MTETMKPESSDEILSKAELLEQGHALAKKLRDELPDSVRFVVFAFQPDGSTSIVTDADHNDVRVVVDRWRDKVFGVAAGEPSIVELAELRRLGMWLRNREDANCGEDPHSIVEAAINRFRTWRSRYTTDVPAGKRVL